MIVAFVFARGGSKGLPGKNLRLLRGKPLLAYAIEQAKLSRADHVAVSSDSEDILEVAEQYGAIAIRRPAEMASDDCPELKAWKHACHMIGKFDVFVSVPCTTPLRQPEDIDACIEALDGDMAVAVTPSHAYHRLAVFDGTLRPLDGRRRQDCPSLYEITGSCYVATRDYVVKTDNLWAGHIKPVLVEPTIDIDTAFDFEIAESLMEKRYGRKHSSA